MHNYIYNSSSPLLVLVGRNEVNSNEVNLKLIGPNKLRDYSGINSFLNSSIV
uniref:Uncharacterized protein n=1 Tax=Picea sitchensis TaxID=3332 RepID=A0A6B9XVZ0_PICSI|nr:hypothetical protein Q903MT_gene2842 [Picea sitchensis]QHR91471.1 hypothetical protein Q903MT_gene5505 [Picea sitchensis]